MGRRRPEEMTGRAGAALLHRQAVGCPRCDDRAWVCEEHPEKPWPHDDCPGPGELCSCEAGRTFKQQLDRQRAGGEYLLDPGLEPVTLSEPLWVLRKEHHTAEAHIRSIPGVGLELRFSDRRHAVPLADFL